VLSPTVSFHGHSTRTRWRIKTLSPTRAPNARSSLGRRLAGNHHFQKIKFCTANQAAWTRRGRPLSYPRPWKPAKDRAGSPGSACNISQTLKARCRQRRRSARFDVALPSPSSREVRTEPCKFPRRVVTLNPRQSLRLVPPALISGLDRMAAPEFTIPSAVH
jgi:hypothetical protein